MDWKSFLTWISNKRRTRRPLLVLTIRDDVNIEAMYTKCVPTGLHSRLSRVLEFDRIESMKLHFSCHPWTSTVVLVWFGACRVAQLYSEMKRGWRPAGALKAPKLLRTNSEQSEIQFANKICWYFLKVFWKSGRFSLSLSIVVCCFAKDYLAKFHAYLWGARLPHTKRRDFKFDRRLCGHNNSQLDISGNVTRRICSIWVRSSRLHSPRQ